MTAMRQEIFSTPTPAFTPVPSGLLQRKCACGGHTQAGGECESCKQRALGLQRKTAVPSEDGDVPPIVHDVLRSPGASMDTGTRAFFEPRFGHDLSGIRLHTDDRAASSAHAVNALAYTVGRDVVFGAGKYAPYTAEGRQLLAHELAHVVQQSHGLHSASASLRISEPSGHFERQADSAARDVLHGRMGGALGAARGCWPGHQRRPRRNAPLPTRFPMTSIRPRAKRGASPARAARR